MNDTSVRRVACFSAIKNAIKEPFEVVSMSGSGSHSAITVVHAATPGWSACIKVTDGLRGKPAASVYINNARIYDDGQTAMGLQVTTALHHRRETWLASARAREEADEKWTKRQEAEAAQYHFPKTVVPEIIRDGPHAGSYRLRLEAGNPFEHLTLRQLTELGAILSACPTNQA